MKSMRNPSPSLHINFTEASIISTIQKTVSVSNDKLQIQCTSLPIGIILTQENQIEKFIRKPITNEMYELENSDLLDLGDVLTHINGKSIITSVQEMLETAKGPLMLTFKRKMIEKERLGAYNPIEIARMLRFLPQYQEIKMRELQRLGTIIHASIIILELTCQDMSLLSYMQWVITILYENPRNTMISTTYTSLHLRYLLNKAIIYVDTKYIEAKKNSQAMKLANLRRMDILSSQKATIDTKIKGKSVQLKNKTDASLIKEVRELEALSNDLLQEIEKVRQQYLLPELDGPYALEIGSNGVYIGIGSFWLSSLTAHIKVTTSPTAPHLLLTLSTETNVGDLKDALKDRKHGLQLRMFNLKLGSDKGLGYLLPFDFQYDELTVDADVISELPFEYNPQHRKWGLSGGNNISNALRLTNFSYYERSKGSKKRKLEHDTVLKTLINKLLLPSIVKQLGASLFPPELGDYLLNVSTIENRIHFSSIISIEGAPLDIFDAVLNTRQAEDSDSDDEGGGLGIRLGRFRFGKRSRQNSYSDGDDISDGEYEVENRSASMPLDLEAITRVMEKQAEQEKKDREQENTARNTISLSRSMADQLVQFLNLAHESLDLSSIPVLQNSINRPMDLTIRQLFTFFSQFQSESSIQLLVKEVLKQNIVMNAYRTNATSLEADMLAVKEEFDTFMNQLTLAEEYPLNCTFKILETSMKMNISEGLASIYRYQHRHLQTPNVGIDGQKSLDGNRIIHQLKLKRLDKEFAVVNEYIEYFKRFASEFSVNVKASVNDNMGKNCFQSILLAPFRINVTNLVCKGPCVGGNLPIPLTKFTEIKDFLGSSMNKEKTETPNKINTLNPVLTVEEKLGLVLSHFVIVMNENGEECKPINTSSRCYVHINNPVIRTLMEIPPSDKITIVPFSTQILTDCPTESAMLHVHLSEWMKWQCLVENLGLKVTITQVLSILGKSLLYSSDKLGSSILNREQSASVWLEYLETTTLYIICQFFLSCCVAGDSIVCTLMNASLVDPTIFQFQVRICLLQILRDLKILKNFETQGKTQYDTFNNMAKANWFRSGGSTGENRSFCMESDPLQSPTQSNPDIKTSNKNLEEHKSEIINVQTTTPIQQPSIKLDASASSVFF